MMFAVSDDGRASAKTRSSTTGLEVDAAQLAEMISAGSVEADRRAPRLRVRGRAPRRRPPHRDERPDRARRGDRHATSPCVFYCRSGNRSGDGGRGVPRRPATTRTTSPAGSRPGSTTEHAARARGRRGRRAAAAFLIADSRARWKPRPNRRRRSPAAEPQSRAGRDDSRRPSPDAPRADRRACAPGSPSSTASSASASMRRRRRDRARARGRHRRRRPGDERQGRERDQGRGRVAPRRGRRRRAGGRRRPPRRTSPSSATGSTRSSRRSARSRSEPATSTTPRSRVPRTTSRTCATDHRPRVADQRGRSGRPADSDSRQPVAPSSGPHPPALGRARDRGAGAVGDAVAAALVELGLELVERCGGSRAGARRR